MLAAIFLMALLLSQADGSTGRTRDLSRDEAIKLAEAAIQRNGCTDFAPLKARRQLSLDRGGVDPRIVIKHTLMCPATHALAGRVEGRPTWIIGFSLSSHCPECTELRERLILMNKDGTHLRLENRKSRIRQILKNNS